jgi:predicted DNA binding protein
MAERTQTVSVSTPRTPSTTTDASTARFELPVEEFALATLFERLPDATVEVEPAVANPDDHALVAITGVGSERAVDAALRSSESVAAVERFGGEGDRQRFRITWGDRARRIIQALTAEDVTLTDIRGSMERWEFRVLAPERRAIARAYEVLIDLGRDPDCRSISLVRAEQASDAGVSEKQHKALTRAFEMGYYDIPRGVTTEELASDLGISHQALSERFRRAHRELIEETRMIR